MQQLGAFRMRRVLQDGAGLRPGDEAARRFGEGDVVGGGRLQAEGGGEGGNVGAVGVGDEGGGGGGAADPAGVLGEEGVEPREALVAEDEGEGVEHGVLVGRGCEQMRGALRGSLLDFGSVEIVMGCDCEGKKGRTYVVVGVGEDELVFELGLEVVGVLLGAVGDVLAVPDVGPAEDADAGEVALRVFVLVVDLIPAEGLVGQEGALGLPARVVVERLEDDAVDIQTVRGELAVDLGGVSDALVSRDGR